MPEFWDNIKNSKILMKRLSHLKEKDEKYSRLAIGWSDMKNLCDLAIEEKDESILTDILEVFNCFKKDLDELKSEVLLSDEFGRNNAILSLHTDSKDEQSKAWVQMLFKMYSEWAEKKGFSVHLLCNGLQSIEFRVIGKYACGYLKGEKGVHQLSKLSKTVNEVCSYEVSVDVIPELDDDGERLYGLPEDYVISRFCTKSSDGHCSYQLVHIPTGLKVWSDGGKSAYEVKSLMLKVMKSRLYEIMMKENLEKIEDIKEIQPDKALNDKIRSYTYYPCKMVKDHRTNVENSNVESVLNGEINEFLMTYLNMPK